MKYNKNEVTGKMRDRIILQNVNRSRSLTGFASESWADVATIWAFAESKLPGSNETIIEGKNTAKNICDFTIRYISSITEESRVVFKNKIYQVKNIKISHDRRFISFQGVYYDSYSTVFGLQFCSASLLAQSSLSAALMRVIKYQASLNAFGSVSADIALVQKVASSLNAFGTLTGDINFVQKVQASLLTSSSVTGNISIPKLVQASLTGVGTTAADLTVTLPGTLLLDLYPSAAAAYSLRKLRTAYTGSAIRVRANTSGAEGDVSFDVNNTISASSTVTVTAVGTSGLSIGQQVTFSTFWNAGGSNQNVFVTRWYDQSGNASNATQTTQANQPQIVSSGILITQNAKATLKYDGSNDYLDAIGVTAGNPKSIFIVTKSNYIGNLEKVIFDSITTNQALLFKSSSDIISLGFGTQIATTYTATLNFILYSVMHNGANSNAFVNSNNQILVNQNLGTNAFNGLRIAGVRGTASLFYNGNISEFIIYSSNQSTNRSGIETNINTHYAIY